MAKTVGTVLGQSTAATSVKRANLLFQGTVQSDVSATDSKERVAVQINLEGVSSTRWQSVPPKEIYPGIRKRALWQRPTGAKATILEIDANAAFPRIGSTSRDQKKCL